MATKQRGDVYTPPDIVGMVLDIAGYTEEADIVGRSLIDPSCGDGAFLVEAARRLVRLCRGDGIAESEIPSMVARCIHGVEIEPGEAAKARLRVCEACAEEGVALDVEDVDVAAADTLEVFGRYGEAFDFVVGNPPYVRIHNLPSGTARSLSYCSHGMTDLYLAFYEIGQSMLSSGGVLCYIAPSSWLTSRSGQRMRSDLERSGALTHVVDLGHEQVFDGFTVYTAIVRMEKTGEGQGAGPESRALSFADIDGYRADPLGTSSSAFEEIPYGECWMEGLLVPIADEAERAGISEILAVDASCAAVRVKNGVATNWDAFYMRDAFEDDMPGTRPAWIRTAVKASTGERRLCLYPYDGDGRLLPFSEFSGHVIEGELLGAKGRLLARTQVDSARWWAYGRSQGIADVEQDKVAVNSLFRGPADVKLEAAPAGVVVYGGAYVLGMGIAYVQAALSSDLFHAYTRALRTYKSGGYYALGGKDIERFLAWWEMRGAGS